jgi:hypothetical protein
MSESPAFTLTFQQMFLLVNRLNGATVLLPSAGHTATLSGSMLQAPITLAGADVRISRDGVDQIEEQTLRPGARYLPYLDYVFNGRVVPEPITRLAEVPPTLNARVVLAGGYLTELQATNPAVRDIEWQFMTSSGDITLTQELTDQVQFTLPLASGGSYELVIRTSGTDAKTTRIPIPATGADLVLLNADAAPKVWSEDNGFYRLREYALLYNLTSAAAEVKTYPYPTALTSTVLARGGGKAGGGADPLCGGGQSDGGDDPPPPPPGA